MNERAIERAKTVVTVAIILGLLFIAGVIFASTALGAAKFLTTPIGFAPTEPSPTIQRVRAIPASMRTAKVSVSLTTPAPKVAPKLKVPTKLPDPAPSDPRAIGKAMAAKRGWIGSQWAALEQLWSEESGWNPRATNRSSGACGIPQRHPCNGLSSLPVKDQIAWGLDYIAGRYGTPASALAAKHSKGWY